MATSSITRNFVVSGREQVERFADAIEESYLESFSKQDSDIPIRYRELKDPIEINNFIKKWKRIHGE